MKWMLITFAVLCLVQREVTGQSSFKFDCRRNTCQGTDSTDSTCDQSTIPPVCTCAAGLTGYSCEGTGTACATATLSCGNGVCEDVGDEGVCVCDQGFYFDKTEATCVERTSVVSCTSTEMTMKIVPYKQFSTDTPDGKIYIAGHDGTAGCLFAKTEANGVEFYTLSQTFAAETCGPALQVDQTQSYKVIVQYGSVVTKLDQALTFECKVLQSGDTSSTTSAAIAIDDQGSDFTGLEQTTTSTDSSSGLTISTTLADGSAITEALFVGTPMMLTIELDTTKDFGFMMLKGVTATDDTGSNTLKLVDAGCAQSGAKTVLTSFGAQTPTNKYVITVGYNLFMFPSSTQLTFTTDIVLCADNTATQCEAQTCTAAAGALISGTIADGIGRRRKRQAGVDSVEKTMEVSLLVVPPAFLGNANSQTATASSTSDCLQSMVFLLPLVLLAVLLLVAMCVALFFCLKVTNRKESDGGFTNAAYKS